ncbi:glycosyltransferase family 2 protein [Bordetella genomosp. 10]|uniref:glycosyltransferase family 2 protein n=1 Tax=Bordetella genomosp. 10 TaxID=1416804 RepID=UPI00211B05D4|nr:glycosyltransferase family 2 protein [Bordetella genomosp. 10]
MSIGISESLPLPSGHVAILLCSYNGEQFLSQQLDSIKAQTYQDWKVWVSDDGSSDRTLEILRAYQDQWGEDRLQITPGPGRGFAANFLSLTCRREIDADYFAYCDQDDVWDADKIERALERLETMGRETPGLYCTRTKLVNEDGQLIGLSPLFRHSPDFRNALVQNVGGGNTMVFNRSARQILVSAGPDLQVVAHDWWTYVAVSAAGGKIFYDPEPSLLYRQHGRNLIGSNNGTFARILRLRRLMHGQLRGWIDQNIAGIRRIAPRLSPSNRVVLEAFVSARNGGALQRVLKLKRSGVFRQTFVDNVGLFAAAFFKKL